MLFYIAANRSVDNILSIYNTCNFSGDNIYLMQTDEPCYWRQYSFGATKFRTQVKE